MSKTPSSPPFAAIGACCEFCNAAPATWTGFGGTPRKWVTLTCESCKDRYLRNAGRGAIHTWKPGAPAPWADAKGGDS